MDRLSSSIRQHTTVAEKLQQAVRDLHAKRGEYDEAIKQAYPQLEVLMGRVKEVKGKVEAALSAQFDNRTVTILEL